MPKKSEVVYKRNKKESAISSLLRYSFLKSVFVEHMTVKEAADKWNVHYSSAKEIARNARKKNLDTVFEREAYRVTAKRAGWKPIDPPDSDSGHGSDEEQVTKQVKPCCIKIINTVGWKFASKGLPPCR